MIRKIQGRKLVVFLLVSILTIPLAYQLAYLGKIFPGVSVLGIPLGNRTKEEAIKIISGAEKFNIPNDWELVYGQQKWPVTFAQIGFSYDFEKTAEEAYGIGRDGKLAGMILKQASLWRRPRDLEMNFRLENERLDGTLATISAQLAIPAVEPAIKIEQVSGKSAILVEAGKDGQEVDQEALRKQIEERLARADFSSVSVPIKSISPKLTPEEAESVKMRAEAMLGKQLVIKGAESRWELDENDLVAFIAYEGGFDREKLAAWIADTIKVINREPQNAAFRFENGRVVEFKPAKNGVELKPDEAIGVLADGLDRLENGGEREIETELPLRSSPPQISIEQVNDLGIKEKIASGNSFFRGSIASRIHNISLASAKINGVLIGPGETFSFNKTLGDVSQATGYQQAYIIKDGRTVLGDGGGVCQVSTTFFRAALNAGLEIVERHAHAYRVAYYEQGFPAGLDATVFDPTADLKVKNNSNTWILVQIEVDGRNKKLTVDLYGTLDGRKISLTTPRIWDQTPPPPDLYQDDPTLPAGQEKQIDWKAWGAKVSFDYRVERDGEVLQTKTFYSAYRPWQAIFLRGTAQL